METFMPGLSEIGRVKGYLDDVDDIAQGIRNNYEPHQYTMI